MNPEVVTIGLGYIGLPTSALIASHGTNVLGVDINQKVVDTINEGKIHIIEPDLDKIVSAAVLKGNLKAATKASTAEVYLIVVPTPFKGNHEPDISFVESATKGIIPLLKKGDLYIIESTSPIGTTEKMQKLIYTLRPELEGDIHIAYCPERVLPGNVMHELVHNDRVIGGIDEASTQKAILFYSKYVKGKLHPTNARTAEMCKLVENSSRDVQIAFANELSLICDKADINVWELINLANKHPRVNILQPGCGVGGHCIAVDPYFIVSDFPQESKMIATAREVNSFKPEWCIEKIKNAQLEFELKNKIKPKTAVLGLAFKPNIDDLRESPALYIAKEIYKTPQKCMIVEPNISVHDFFDLTNLKKAIKLCDIIVILVKHDEFKSLVLNENQLLIDFCGV
ncbi:UDP-N-acetyl-D-mannosamine dehydrogenase [Flavobacteriales bacterium]|nr:UDP-N-acetyl-D-mannosamine dehydrogenase [Flavobacteriales bacterium]